MKSRGLLILLAAFICWGLAVATPGFAEYGDIVLNSKADSMKEAGVNPVMFPHWFHRIRFKCKVCHVEIFKMQKGANDINMTEIMNGNFCGRCHNGLVAWEALYCDRCHSYTGQ